MRVPRAVTASADRRGADAPGPLEVRVRAIARDALSTNLVELPGPPMAHLGQPHTFAEARKPIVLRLA